jgi:hypothetical protein
MVLFIAARNAVAPVMLMTVWAWAEEANPRAAIPAKRLNFNFMVMRNRSFSEEVGSQRPWDGQFVWKPDV